MREPEPRVKDLKEVMYYEYDLMFHYFFALLRRADGANSVTAAGVKILTFLLDWGSTGIYD
jgi:hypothetical protein